LYQQSPAIASGNIFKRKTFRYFYYDKDTQCYILNDTRQNFTGKKLKSSKIYPNLFDSDNIANTENSKDKINKSECKIYAVVDLAATTKQTSDYTAIIVFAITPHNQILILDIIRAKFEGSEHLDLLKEIYNL
jgi:phage terminase large subunit-like protein